MRRRVLSTIAAKWLSTQYELNRFYEGNKIIIPAYRFHHHPLRHSSRHITSRGALHLVASALWLTASEAGTACTLPILFHFTFTPFLLKGFCRPFYETMRAGGATAFKLADSGASPSVIQAFKFGHWASELFWFYVQKNPTLLLSLLANLLSSSPPHLQKKQKKKTFIWFY
jgi:hypothetical protein